MDREFYKRYYAVQFTRLKEDRKDLSLNQQLDMALKETEQKYFDHLEKAVRQKDIGRAYDIVGEFRAFVHEGFLLSGVAII